MCVLPALGVTKHICGAYWGGAGPVPVGSGHHCQDDDTCDEPLAVSSTDRHWCSISGWGGGTGPEGGGNGVEAYFPGSCPLHPAAIPDMGLLKAK